MIFIIPLIFGATAVVTGVLGVAAGADGLDKMEEARKIAAKAEKRYEGQQERVKSVVMATQAQAETYGRLQIEVNVQTVGRFVRFLERRNRKGRQSDPAFWQGMGIPPQQLANWQRDVNGASEAWSLLQAAGTAWAAGQGAIGMAALFGTASTGTAIGSLSGAAAWNATLAWLGGGSLASGGGGMALGAWVLGGIVVGPALMVGGFALGSKGEKALTDAWAYAAEVDTAVTKMVAYIDFLGQVQRRISELQMLVLKINEAATQSLEELEQEILRNRDFDPKRSRDAQLFQRAALLVKTLSELLKIPVLDKNGNLHPQSLAPYHRVL